MQLYPLSVLLRMLKDWKIWTKIMSLSPNEVVLFDQLICIDISSLILIKQMLHLKVKMLHYHIQLHSVSIVVIKVWIYHLLLDR